jgi:hypothetical protein
MPLDVRLLRLFHACEVAELGARRVGARLVAIARSRARVGTA